MFNISAFAQGFVRGLGLFVVPGPKDVVVLREALRQRGSFDLVLIGVVSDALLTLIGIGGVSAALSSAPDLRAGALWLGVLLLVIHGLSAADRSVRGAAEPSLQSGDDFGGSRRRAIIELLVVSFLNPVVWLDTLLIVGSVGAALPKLEQVSFGIGAVCASVTWFSVLTIGANTLGGWMTRPSFWRLFEGFVAIAMFGIAGYVASSLL